MANNSSIQLSKVRTCTADAMQELVAEETGARDGGRAFHLLYSTPERMRATRHLRYQCSFYMGSAFYKNLHVGKDLAMCVRRRTFSPCVSGCGLRRRCCWR